MFADINYLRMYFVICFVAVDCNGGGDCTPSPGTTCVADYCQRTSCTATGQCVFGQKCSQNADYKICVCTSVTYVYYVLNIDFFCSYNVVERRCV